MFSSRVPGELEPNRLTQKIREARRAGRALIDLTADQSDRRGDCLSRLAARRARGCGVGALRARSRSGPATPAEAVARDYERRGIKVAPERVVLTASTSEAYSILFKLLCNPSGDSVMVPVPSYPLFDHLTALDGVRAVPYRLEYHGRWAVDFDALDERWDRRVRAVLAVSPNNPTGSTLTAAELAGLSNSCASRDAALIVDEVFADYPLSVAAELPAYDAVPALTFRLGGLSKTVGLPQVKLGWIAVDGPEPLVHDALQRLELICDTYLSVSTPVQVAAARLLSDGAVVRDRILDRVRTNDAALRVLASGFPSVDALHADAGWSAVLRVPATRSEEGLALELLERDGVVVHPGFFFDFPHEAFLVLSLLPESSVFTEGVRRLLARAA